MQEKSSNQKLEATSQQEEYRASKQDHQRKTDFNQAGRN